MATPDFVFEDWKMAKDRIKHFDDVVVRIRLQGLGIAATIMSIGAASLQFTGAVRFPLGPFTLAGSALIVLLGALYLIPVAALDWLHYQLLIRSVGRALEIERLPDYRGKLCITTELTSFKLTRLHNVVLVAVYSGLAVFGVILFLVLNAVPTPTAAG